MSEDFEDKRKFARWRASYIHNTLKSGQVPISSSTIILGPNQDFDSIPSMVTPEEFEKITGRPPKIVDSPINNVLPPNPFEDPPNLDLIQQPPLQPTPVLPPRPRVQEEPAAEEVSNSSGFTPEQIGKAQKYCKFAGSALNYDDVNTAVDNLTKALNLLKYGKEEM